MLVLKSYSRQLQFFPLSFRQENDLENSKWHNAGMPGCSKHTHVFMQFFLCQMMRYYSEFVQKKTIYAVAVKQQCTLFKLFIRIILTLLCILPFFHYLPQFADIDL